MKTDHINPSIKHIERSDFSRPFLKAFLAFMFVYPEDYVLDNLTVTDAEAEFLKDLERKHMSGNLSSKEELVVAVGNVMDELAANFEFPDNHVTAEEIADMILKENAGN